MTHGHVSSAGVQQYLQCTHAHSLARTHASTHGRHRLEVSSALPGKAQAAEDFSFVGKTKKWPNFSIVCVCVCVCVCVLNGANTNLLWVQGFARMRMGFVPICTCFTPTPTHTNSKYMHNITHTHTHTYTHTHTHTHTSTHTHTQTQTATGAKPVRPHNI